MTTTSPSFRRDFTDASLHHMTTRSLHLFLRLVFPSDIYDNATYLFSVPPLTRPLILCMTIFALFKGVPLTNKLHLRRLNTNHVRCVRSPEP